MNRLLSRLTRIVQKRNFNESCCFYSRSLMANRDIQEYFDNPIENDVHHFTSPIGRSSVMKMTESTGTTANTAITKTGLFQYQNLQTSQDLLKASLQAQTQAEEMINVILTEDQTKLVWTIKRLDRLSDLICSVVDTAEFIRNVHPDQNFVQAANQVHDDLSQVLSWLNVHQGLYTCLKQVLNQKKSVREGWFLKEEKRVGELLLADFEKSGVHMEPKNRAAFIELNTKILQSGQRFLMDTHQLEDSFVSVEYNQFMKELFPERYLRSFKDPNNRNMLRIPIPSIFSQMILSQCPNESVRRKVFLAINRSPRCHLENLEKMLIGRSELASLIGKRSYAHAWLEDKMIRTPENVLSFLKQVHQIVYPKAQKEYQSLLYLKQSEDPKATTIYEWDRDYYLKKGNNQSNVENSRISTGRVFHVLNQVLSKIFGIQLQVGKLQENETWHPTVRKLDVVDERGTLLGVVYCDLLDRPNKMNGAAHFTVCCSRRTDWDNLDPCLQHIQRPFSSPNKMKRVVGDKEFQVPIVVLSMNLRTDGYCDLSQASTIFHEMGHAIHSMVGATEFQHIAGTRVPMDFVEVPSTLMELFADSNFITCLLNNKENKSLDSVFQLYSDMNVSSSFHNEQQNFSSNSLAHTERMHQLQLSMMDQLYHSFIPFEERNFDSTKIATQVYQQYGVFPLVPSMTPQGTFGHLFTYGASYYSYYWSRVLAKRIWGRLFQNKGSLKEWRIGGEKVYHELLSVGGSRDPWEGLKQIQVVSAKEVEHNQLEQFDI